MEIDPGSPAGPDSAPASLEAEGTWPGVLAGVPRAGVETPGAAAPSLSRLEAAAVAALLRHRFDDGRVHARGRDDRRLLRKATRCGLVDASGYLTAAGRRLLDAHPSAT